MTVRDVKKHCSMSHKKNIFGERPPPPKWGTKMTPHPNESRGEYFSKNLYFCTNPKNGPARDSRDTLSLDSNISTRTPEKVIFLHMVVIFLHGPKQMRFFCTIEQLNKKLAKSALYHIIQCFPAFP